MKTYIIVIAKNGKDVPEIETYINSIFTIVWKMRKNNEGETWMCAREYPINSNDVIAAIKAINKRVKGVVIFDVHIKEMCLDKDGVFNVPGRDGIELIANVIKTGE